MKIEGEDYEFHLDGKRYHCALDITMDYIGGKWKAVVLWYLRKEKKRFNELKKHIPEITEKMLSLQLKALEKDGLVIREVFAEVPPKVEYCLSTEGKTLIPVIEALADWGRKKGKKGELIKVATKAKKPTINR